MRCAVALLSLAGMLAAQTPTPEPKGAIRGLVRDSTGVPVSGISVEAALGDVVLTIQNGSNVVLRSRTASSTTDNVKWAEPFLSMARASWVGQVVLACPRSRSSSGPNSARAGRRAPPAPRSASLQIPRHQSSHRKARVRGPSAHPARADGILPSSC